MSYSSLTQRAKASAIKAGLRPSFTGLVLKSQRARRRLEMRAIAELGWTKARARSATRVELRKAVGFDG